jgi:hypothetical protein
MGTAQPASNTCTSTPIHHLPDDCCTAQATIEGGFPHFRSGASARPKNRQGHEQDPNPEGVVAAIIAGQAAAA